MKPRSFRRALVGTGLLLLATGAGSSLLFAAYYGIIAKRISDRLDELRSARGTRFLAVFPTIEPKQRYSRPELTALLSDQGFMERPRAEELVPGEYSWESAGTNPSLVLSRPAFEGKGFPLEALRVRIQFEAIGPELHVRAISRAADGEPLERYEAPPKKIGSFVAGRLRSQDAVPFSEIPSAMRFAAMAIEDVHFLDHSGVSLRSTVRALFRDLQKMRLAEGGSTITQQLMKNLFFSREKTLLRKVKEALYAVVAESRHKKDDILEAYLNEVYLGQWGAREIHGVAEGAEIYFGRPVSQITVSQAAVLAAIVQAPNALDPFRHPERTLKRRDLVLQKMLQSDFLSQEEYDGAIKEPLGVLASDRSLKDTDYYLDLVMARLTPAMARRVEQEQLTLYVTLNPYLQAQASRALNENLIRLRKQYLAIRKKEEKGRHLESALVAIDPGTCDVVALQGGHSYRTTQFNRVLQGKRQPGSLFKPFVYLTALSGAAETHFSPLTVLDDSPFEWKYDNQLWKPKNYDGDFKGQVTAQEALENSMNIPTARLAQLIGINAIAETLYRAGIRTEVPRVPSLVLGSPTVTPLEVSEAYTTLANLGSYCQTRTVLKGYDENGNLVVENPTSKQPVLSPEASFQTVHMLKGVFSRGTARSAQSSGILLDRFAGKTGTTNEGLDAWFVGFSPRLVVLVWVGFDEEEKLGMTGGTAALPAWVEFVRSARPFLGDADFVAPERLRSVEVNLKRRCVTHADDPDAVLEYFLEGSEPPDCPTT